MGLRVCNNRSPGWDYRDELVGRREEVSGEDQVLKLMEKISPPLFSAWMPVLEDLERRQLLSTSTIQTLPFSLDFSSDRGEIADKDGQGTGFTRLQTNKLGTQYQANLIDLDTASGVLRMTTGPGSATTGSNSGTSDNTLINGLET